MLTHLWGLLSKDKGKQAPKASYLEAGSPRWDKGVLEVKNQRKRSEKRELPGWEGFLPSSLVSFWKELEIEKVVREASGRRGRQEEGGNPVERTAAPETDLQRQDLPGNSAGALQVILSRH